MRVLRWCYEGLTLVLCECHNGWYSGIAWGLRMRDNALLNKWVTRTIVELLDSTERPSRILEVCYTCGTKITLMFQHCKSCCGYELSSLGTFSMVDGVSRIGRVSRVIRVSRACSNI
jgi:hypothetical protein